MTAASKLRWLVPTPAWLVYGAAVATGVLFASERWRWFAFNQHKGYTVLLAVAVVGAALVVLSASMLVALLFRRRVQFGLRTLLVFVTLCAFVCSWLAVRIKQARRQAELVAAVRGKFGTGLIYDWEFGVGGDFLPNALPPGPESLRKVFGVDFFGDVESLGLYGPGVTDEDLANIAVLTRLKVLWLNGDNFTDAGLSHIEGLTNLRDLQLIDAMVTEEGVKKLQRALPNCKIEVFHTAT